MRPSRRSSTTQRPMSMRSTKTSSVCTRSRRHRRQAARQVVGETREHAAEIACSQVISVRPAMEKGVGFIRLFGARYLARQQGVSPAEIARSKGWGEDIEEVLRMPQDIVQRAAVAAGTTTDSAWAGRWLICRI